jgi:hypothetical protein
VTFLLRLRFGLDVSLLIVFLRFAGIVIKLVYIAIDYIKFYKDK